MKWPPGCNSTDPRALIQCSKTAEVPQRLCVWENCCQAPASALQFVEQRNRPLSQPAQGSAPHNLALCIQSRLSLRSGLQQMFCYSASCKKESSMKAASTYGRRQGTNSCPKARTKHIFPQSIFFPCLNFYFSIRNKMLFGIRSWRRTLLHGLELHCSFRTWEPLGQLRRVNNLHLCKCPGNNTKTC